MANLSIKDGNGVARTVKTVESGGVHTPVHRAEGPLTNDELRASAVSVTGPVTDAQLRATPVPVSGPVTNAELRAEPVEVEVVNTPSVALEESLHEIPTTCGTYSVTPGASLASPITIPTDATGVRIFAWDADVRFNLDGAVGAPSAAALTLGGIAKAGMWREVRWEAGAFTSLYFLSSETTLGGDATPAYFDVEFFKPAD